MIIAEDIYNQLTEFNDPWQFWVVDNFFKLETYNKLLQIANNKTSNVWAVIDKSDGNKIYSNKAELPNLSKKNSCHLTEVKPIINYIQDTVKEKLSSDIYQNYKVISDLVECEPNYYYHTHRDHTDKKVSIIVYLSPEDGDGTTLVDSDKKTYEVKWRKNRAVLFRRNDQSYHFYRNTKNQTRLSLNIYLCEFFSKFIVY